MLFLSLSARLRRESAWFIPGGILAGIGLGDYLTEASFLASNLSEGAATGVFLLSFALGWVGVFVLSKRFGDVPNSWALIPAIVMTVIGTLLLSAGVGERVLGGGELRLAAGLGRGGRVSRVEDAGRTMTETLLIVAHVGAGVAALLVAPVAMLDAKRRRRAPPLGARLLLGDVRHFRDRPSRFTL